MRIFKISEINSPKKCGIFYIFTRNLRCYFKPLLDTLKICSHRKYTTNAFKGGT